MIPVHTFLYRREENCIFVSTQQSPQVPGSVARATSIYKHKHASLRYTRTPYLPHDTLDYLISAYEATVPAGRQALIKTDLSIAIPPNTYARIAPRSGLAVKKMIDCGAGVVDYDYRGPVGVVLFNHGTEDFKVNKGDRVAQLILERICMADIEEVRLCGCGKTCIYSTTVVGYRNISLIYLPKSGICRTFRNKSIGSG